MNPPATTPLSLARNENKLSLMTRSSLKLLAAAALILTAASLQAQDWAKAALEKSPRHREYVTLKHDGRTLQAFVVYPEISNKTSVIVMIHEIFGLSDWAKEMADELAAKGYIVIAPDLLSGAGPNAGGTDAFASQDQVTKAVSGLSPDQVAADLDAAADYGKKLPSANGKLFVAGFCWGGGKSFAFATHRHDLSAAFVFYGPPPADVASITAPVYGFYAGNDARISSTIPATTEAMKAAHKTYEPVLYDGAGHGFMRAGQAPDATDANKKAFTDGFKRLTDLLDKLSTATTSSLTPAAPETIHAELATAAISCHDPATHESNSTPTMTMAAMTKVQP
jgi:carboxymethylenebutenolidase